MVMFFLLRINGHVLSATILFICFVIFLHSTMASDESEGITVDKETGATSIGRLTNWIVDIEKRGTQEELSCKAYIHKVPAHKRDLNRDLFTPKFISFGPFHHDHPELKKINVHKERALVHFLRRKNQSCQNIIQEVVKIITELRDAYYCLDDKWKTNDEEFLKMMIVDGCFMHEVLHIDLDKGHPGNRIYPLDDYSDKHLYKLDLEPSYSDMDPFFSKHAFLHKWDHIKRDMLLIENQLPLLLLKALVLFQPLSNMAKQDIDRYVNRLVLDFFGMNYTSTTLGLHPLDLYRRSTIALEQVSISSSFADSICSYNTRLPSKCAVDLWEAGVNFKPSKIAMLNEIIFNNIIFNKKSGTLYLPAVSVDGNTESCLLNVIAYEDLQVNMEHVVTSYACLMHALLKSANDVRVLRDNNIIHTHLVSNEEVVGIFDRIAKDTTMDWRSSLFHMRVKIGIYSWKRRNRWRATLVHDYFKSPWSAFSLVGALLVIGLTIIATVYTVLQYYQSS